MQEKKRKVVLTARQKLLQNSEYIEKAEREGIELDKGSVLTQAYLERHEEDLRKWGDLFTAYPDYYLDIIRPVDHGIASSQSLVYPKYQRYATSF